MRVRLLSSTNNTQKSIVCHFNGTERGTISFFSDAARLCSASTPPLELTAFPSFPSVSNIRASRKDNHLHSTSWLLRVIKIGRSFTGAIHMPSLPPFTMSRSSSTPVPATPRVISPSPTPSETRERQQDGYFGPVTRSAQKKKATILIDEGIDEDGEVNGDLRRARSKSRSPMRMRQLGLTSAKMTATSSTIPEEPILEKGNGHAKNGHLSPASANGKFGWSWRDISRSPSPLGLIPIHRHWRSFIHRHEVPRKLLHVSIGFFSVWLYVTGVQTTSITPYLMGALIPIATIDYLRHAYPPLNRLYVRLLGALMRETEYEGWNGVIWYLLGAWLVLGFFPKDVGLMGVLLLSWCDTAASTIGRLYGRYTPRIRRGKSLAGSFAAFLVGVITAIYFWGWLAPRMPSFVDNENFPFMFTGTLTLPGVIRNAVGLTEDRASISGGWALGLMSLWTGFVASASEVVDIFGWDDNLTIPVLSGIGMWGFLKIFG